MFCKWKTSQNQYGNSMKRNFLLLFFLSVLLQINIYSQQSAAPERIILNLTENPSREIAVTWRTEQQFTNSEIQFAQSTSWIEFKNNVIKVPAIEENFMTDDGKAVYHYSAILKNLQPKTNYLYRVGHDSIWSEWNQFTTASNENIPFKFLFIGDPQNDIKEHCSRVFRQAYKTAPDAALLLFTGDLVTNTSDILWSEFFDAGGFIFRTIPSILTPGNHEHKLVKVDGKFQRSKILDPSWNVHFTLPENGPKEFKESSYYVDYQGVRFIILNSHYNVKEQAVWVEKVLQNNSNKWTVAAFHVPIYSMGSGRDSKVTREPLMPLFDKYGVDLVLTGHDHAYGRSKKIYGGKVVPDSSKGTVYVVSVSGPKMYALNPLYKDLMAKTAANVSLFQVIYVEKNQLKYQSFTADGNLFDTFFLTK
ncbi:MAG: metallophosphoesterase [Ignavibacteria bacterium]|nr:MAG: metallophosphoesterase [Ignavibacteria bacterium]KAF0161716.1 MAG: metallophosphoesterase [Ignavibacteria bacterium]